MKRLISALALVAMSLTLVTGCKKRDSGIPFDYDLSKYITLGEYTGIEYTYSVAEVTDEAVEAYVNSMLAEKGYGEETQFTEGAVKNGDTVNIDFKGLMNGEEFSGGSSEGYELTIGSNSFIEGFESGLIGHEIGKEVVLDLTFPENYGNEQLNGKPVQFIVRINSLKRTVYPELTDELVKEISTDITDVASYMTYANDMVAYNNESAAIDEMEGEIWTKVVGNATVSKFPADEVEKYKAMILETMDSLANSQYGMTYEEFLDQAYGKTLEDVDAELTGEAENAVKEYMTVVAIARDQDLVPTDEEYDAEVAEYATTNGYSDVTEFLEAVDKEQLYLTILINRVMDFVVENATEVK